MLPDLARRAKACRKEQVQDVVLQICEYHVYGFLEHCLIDQSILDCLLINVNLV